MVLLTIAISGGPFLGLLGTVVGVMITFAAIAATGDVNVFALSQIEGDSFIGGGGVSAGGLSLVASVGLYSIRASFALRGRSLCLGGRLRRARRRMARRPSS